MKRNNPGHWEGSPYLGIVHQVVASFEAIVELWHPPRSDDLKEGAETRSVQLNHSPWPPSWPSGPTILVPQLQLFRLSNGSQGLIPFTSRRQACGTEILTQKLTVGISRPERAPGEDVQRLKRGQAASLARSTYPTCQATQCNRQKQRGKGPSPCCNKPGLRAIAPITGMNVTARPQPQSPSCPVASGEKQRHIHAS